MQTTTNTVAEPELPTLPSPTRKGTTVRHRVLVVGCQLLILALFLVIWQVAADRGWVNSFFTSRPTDVFNVITDWVVDGTIFANVGITLLEAGLGFALGIIVGIPVGFLLARVRFLDDVSRPFLDVLNATPRMALVSLFVLWLGLGISSKVALTFSVVVFVFIINTYAGVKGVEEDYIRAARLLGASRWALEWKVVLPATVPILFAGVRLGVAYALSATIVAEIVAANRGLGFLIAQRTGTLDTAGALAATVVLMLVAWVINQVPNRLERRLSRWNS